jgi:nitrate reductase NapE component
MEKPSPKKNLKNKIKKLRKEIKRTRITFLFLFLVIVAIVIVVLVFSVLTWMNTNMTNGNLSLSHNVKTQERLSLPTKEKVMIPRQQIENNKQDKEPDSTQIKKEEKTPELIKFKSLIV